MTPYGWPRATARAGIIVLSLLLGLTACAPSALTVLPEVVTPASDVKLIVSQDGLYAVSFDVIRKSGLDLSSVDEKGITLTTGGEPAAFELAGEGRQRELRFYGRAIRRPGVSTQNVYWLQAGANRETASAGDAPLDPGVALSDTGQAVVRAEQQSRFLTSVGPDEERWFWTSIFAPAELAVTLTTPEATPGEATLRLRVWAESSAAVEPDHHVVVTLNDALIADVTWDGLGAHLIEAPVPEGLLHAGENRVKIISPGDTGAIADSVLVDWVEIAYPRRLSLQDKTLDFTGAAPGFRVRLPDGGRLRAGKDLTLWDVTDVSRPVPLTEYVVEGSEVRFGSDGMARRFMLAVREGFLAPDAVQPATTTALPDWPGGADLIVVTTPQLRPALQPLIEKRQSAGLRVAVFDVGEVFDAFSHGRPDPAAIQTLVQAARARWTPPAPRFLLLAGDASYDPDGYTGGAEADLIPTQYVMTTFTGWTASDVWFAMPPEAFAGDGVTPQPAGPPLKPVLAVGRLPAQTEEQMRAMVSKILAYELGDPLDAWHRRAVFPADNDDSGFKKEAATFASALQGYDSELILVSGDGSEARASLLAAFDSGVGMIGYTGHGSVTLWAQENILSIEDVPVMKNRDRLPLVFTVTCLSGFFVHPTTSSLGEALVRSPDGGAVAALVPSSAALLMDQQHLSQALASALAVPPAGSRPAPPVSLGDIIVEAQSSLPIDSEGVREVLLTFNLLGDPSLTLVR